MIGVLRRFRQHPVPITCDIERMFHQFLVTPKDRNYLRFLWWPMGDVRQAPEEYRMRVHLFGAASSPGCANYGLKFLANIHKKTMPLASDFVQRNFYVDDGLLSVETIDMAVKIGNSVRALCQSGGLRLQKVGAECPGTMLCLLNLRQGGSGGSRNSRR